MKQVDILVQIDSHQVDAVYTLLRDFQRYPAHSKTVRSVSILEMHPESAVSRWEVNFHQGILQWTEEDRFDPINHTIHFQQLEGDAELFAGSWRVFEQDQKCLIHFQATFDMGIPTLRDIIEPIAERALRENIVSIIEGLFSSSVDYIQNVEQVQTC